MALSESPVEHQPWVPEDTFGARLAQIRQQMHWNVKQAAEHCELNYQSWHNWERGGLPRDIVETVHQIAMATGCSERWLLLGAEHQNRKDLTGPDLQLVHDSTAGDGTSPGPGQMVLPFRAPLRVVR